MFLVQLFLPLRDHQGVAFPRAAYDEVRRELTTRFGGVTAFVRSPALGLWQDEEGALQRDEVVLFEVMVDHVEHGWWAAHREVLRQRFLQDEVLVRALAMERL